MQKSSPTASPSLLSQDGWAEVRAHNQVVRYRRTGAGRPTLLLDSRRDGQGLWPEVIDALAAGYRLIVPTPPERGTDVELWLAALIDGLGVPNLTVIATEAFGLAPLEATLGRCDQVARIVIVSRSANTSGSVIAAEIPVLVVQRDRPADEIIPVLLEFLVGSQHTGHA
jgi:hypothetical protein